MASVANMTDRWRLDREALAFAASGVLAVVVCIFGGSSWNARVTLTVCELASLPVAALAARVLVQDGKWRGALWPLAVFAAMFAILLAESVPLPPQVWLRAPGQEPRFTAYVLSGLDLAAAPLSLDPAKTLAAVPALFPPLAMFLAALALTPARRSWIAALFLAMTILGLLLGLLQMTQADGGWAYLYGETNPGSLVGWFANRNHEAALLLCLIPLAFAALSARGAGRWVAGAFLLVVLVALGANRSRAGIILAGPVLMLSLAVLMRDRSAGRPRWMLPAAAAVASTSVAAVAIFSLTPILSRFGAASLPEFRYKAWPLIWAEAAHHLPFGSGVGTFDRVFRAIEPLQFVVPAFFNHAHNDFLEIWLETGWFGAAVLLGALAWIAWASVIAWRKRGSNLARACGVAVLALLAMSWVDYPLRTETLATLMAFLLAAMVPPRANGRAGA